MPLSKCTGPVAIEHGVHEPKHIEVAGRKLKLILAECTFLGVDYKIYRHPELLLSETVNSWKKDYEYTKDFHVAIPYEDRHPCWVDLSEMWGKVLEHGRNKSTEHNNTNT